MSIKVAVQHHTRYEYDRPVHLSPHMVRLRPAPHTRTPVLAYSLKIEPGGHFINWQQDPFGNQVARLVFPEPVTSLTLNVDLIADLTVINPFDFFVEQAYEQFPFQYASDLAEDLRPYLHQEAAGPGLSAWLKGVPRKPRHIVDFLVDFNQRLQKDIEYVVRFEPGVQSGEETLSLRRGSCRDSAWLLVQLLRQIGLAARFVSGYLVQLTPDQKPLEGPEGPVQDFTDLHAWAEVFIPGAGWIGLDPTSGLFAGEGHIPLACTPHPSGAAPLTGASDPCETRFHYSNHVERLPEEARVTKPYTEMQWGEILRLGDRVDEVLTAYDCRLTMGGEPTFVSIDDMDGAEWNTEALGETKRGLAHNLARRLQTRFAAGGLLHYGQGKWYPGEPLPRWAFSCLWRVDGEPVWRDPAWLADEARDYGAAVEDAARFIEVLASCLGLTAETITPGFEDPYYYLWREAGLPINVDPLQSDLKDPLERKRLARLLDRGLEKPTGYVLPLRWLGDWGAAAWQSGKWSFRRERMYLIPGDSSMGLRLPLESLPVTPPTQEDRELPRDSFTKTGPLPVMQYAGVCGRVGATKLPEYAAAKARAVHYATDVVRTALCVEPREGRLYVFMPPVEDTAGYLDLVAAIEATAVELKMPVTLEGYLPPSDPRLKHFQITPDPGVIEVNIQPAYGWRELAGMIEALYEEARLSRLGTEKFMLDGRHVGTGGGNHVVLGGPTPADSPLLRRPDLLPSLLSCWQHHPSLSYLFAGLFVGPTSQAPRVDEARDDQLHELDIAFSQIPELAGGETLEPWLTDRVLRHLLVDITGNTHRAEFCIDKLYSPDGPSGRRGLVEFRAFEMPPHARMSAVQMLLLRTLMAWFWEKPYTQRLVRWGTVLHDRYALPHFLWLDLEQIIGEINEAGFPFRLEWLLPFYEFRFPRLGHMMERGIEVELRMAIEPWHVLGEEAAAGGMSRYVDSSVERVQVKVTGLNPERYVLACNGRRVPLKTADVAGTLVAGVRYKAWQPYSGLHPRIGVQAPLTFDLVDLAVGRSIGGCTYHVSHPAGRNYQTFPVNAAEAEARRAARFWAHGHSQHPMSVPVEETQPEYPFTLDLRIPGP